MQTRLFGVALIGGGSMAMVANGAFSPLLPIEAPFAELAGSEVFLARLSLAAAGLMLVLLGMIGLHIRQAAKVSWFGALAFVLAFCGTAALMAHEWAQVFFIHHIAKTVPTALDAMEDVAGPNLFDAEAIIAAASFALGWILWCGSLLMAHAFSRLGPVLVLLGLLGAPILSAIGASLGLNPAWVMAGGGVLFALGWIVLGRELLKTPVAP